MPSRGELTVVSAQPWEELFKADYSTESESESDGGCLRIKNWKRIVIQKNIKPWDKMFSILHYGNEGVYWFFIFTLVRMSSLLGDIYEESLARVILWNFVFVLAKLKDLCVLDIIYVIYMR